MKNIKPFLIGFNYAVKHFEKLEDHHFHTLPASHNPTKQDHEKYRKGVAFGRKYMQYRFEILAFYITLVGIAVITIY